MSYVRHTKLWVIIRYTNLGLMRFPSSLSSSSVASRTSLKALLMVLNQPEFLVMPEIRETG